MSNPENGIADAQSRTINFVRPRLEEWKIRFAALRESMGERVSSIFKRDPPGYEALELARDNKSDLPPSYPTDDNSLKRYCRND